MDTTIWRDYQEREEKYNENYRKYKNMLSQSIDSLLEQQLAIANSNLEKNKKKQKRMKKKKTKRRRKKTKRRRKKKKEEEKDKEEEAERKQIEEENNKIKKQFKEIINSIENLENENYVNLLNRIEQLTDLELSTNLETNLREISNRIDQESEIKKEISDLFNKYKKLKNTLRESEFSRFRFTSI